MTGVQTCALPIYVAGTLEFACGAVINIATSFDTPKHRHSPIELYGSQASLAVPDPNIFGGPVEIAHAGQDWQPVPLSHGFGDANYRSIGVADMAHALRGNRPHRASGELAMHVLEVMEAFQRSSDSGQHISIRSRPERPAAMPTDTLA